MKKNLSEGSSFWERAVKIFKVMKLVLFFTILGILGANANSSYSQNARISLDLKNAKLQEVITEIQKQTEFVFFYSPEDVMEIKNLNVKVKEAKLQQVLEDCFKNTDLEYEIKHKAIVLKRVPKTNQGSSGGEKTIEQPQKKTITGKVTDVGEIPLPGVSIVVKGTTIGITSDRDGNYTLEIPDDAQILVFSFVGMKSREIIIGSQTQIDVTLEEETVGLDEVVAIGYGTRSKADISTAVSTVKSSTLKDIPVSGIDQALAGYLSGVNIVQESGAPGSNVSFRIRGLAAISASSEPLIVLDGIPLERGISLSSIDPNTVESVDVLKDAAAASIYGSRGSNGVVLITTKQGKTGDVEYSFNAYYGVQAPSKTIELQDAYGQANYINEALRNDYISQNPGVAVPTDPSLYGFPSELVPYLNGEAGLVNTDWQDEIFRNASMNNYELSARGGNDKVRFYVSGNYFNQEGIIISTDYKRLAFRSNIDVDLSEKLKLSVKLAPSYSKSDRVKGGTASVNSFEAPPVTTALFVSPFFPSHLPNGEIAVNSIIEGSAEIKAASGNKVSLAPYVNPVALAKLNDFDRKDYRLLGSISLEYKILKDLIFKTQVSTDYFQRKENFFKPSTVGRRGIVNTSPKNEIYGRYYGRSSLNWITENTLTYNKTINEDHHFNALLGYTAQKVIVESESIQANNFPNNNIQTLNAGIVTDGSTYITEYSLLSQIGRLMYDYKGKYYFSASIRRDGSSRFGKNNRFGIFPSLSVAYRVSREDFFPNNKVFSDIKLRGSWGETGNFFIPNHGALAKLSPANYPIGGSIQPGLAISSSPNSNLTWENTSTMDIGIDLSLFESKINIVADYYKSKTNDLLFNLPVPTQSGFKSTLQNVGSMESNGFEVSVNGFFEFGDFVWEPGVNFNRNRHEVTNLNLDDPVINDWYWRTEEGGVVGAFLGYNSLGTFTSQEQLDALPHHSKAKIGSYIWEDANGDGKISSADKTITGDPYPDYALNFTSRFSYKGFDASLVVQSVQGFDVFWNAGRDRFLAQGLWSNHTVDYFENGYKSPENPGIYPAPASSGSNRPDNSYYRDSDITIFDGSYVRIKNITLGYSLPDSVTEKLGLKNLRVYVSSTNPFTFTDYPGFDPESSNHSSEGDSRPNGVTPRPGRDLDSYPTAKNIVFGVNVNF